MTDSMAEGYDHLPLQQERQIWRYRGGDWQQVADHVATEYALTVFVNDQEMATVVCTPSTWRIWWWAFSLPRA
ncbi:hypothetical protein GCM10025857_29990 [Alicyclobacillus contaminans]|nr:hypothetical protein GCM10025857_29990 [Alicyclobacillus contaminans]